MCPRIMMRVPPYTCDTHTFRANGGTLSWLGLWRSMAVAEYGGGGFWRWWGMVVSGGAWQLVVGHGRGGAWQWWGLAVVGHGNGGRARWQGCAQ